MKGASLARDVRVALGVLLISLSAGSGGCTMGPIRSGSAGGHLRPPQKSGPPPLRRLTRREYDNTVRDLLGDTRGLAGGFGRDALGSGGFTIGGLVSGVEAVQFLDAAETIAHAAVGRLDLLLPCHPGPSGDDRCIEAFIQSFGKRAWRRPLIREESARLLALYRQVRSQGARLERGVEVLLAALLQSPGFLYHQELMPHPSAYDLAARLSYFLWATMPDRELFALADSGDLTRPDIFEGQARRMLADPRAGEAINAFTAGWLDLEDGGAVEKDRGRFPDFNDEVRASVQQETPLFVRRVVLEGDGRLETLLTARFTWADAPLARLYGIDPPSSVGDPVTFPSSAGRSGLLTQALLLARNAGPAATSPTRRGKLIRERILCQILPPPPPNVDTTPPVAKKDASVREQIEDHALQVGCAGCHDRLDPIGLTLEGFDAIGRAQNTDGGKPIDTTGALQGTDVDGPLTGAVDLGLRLVRSEHVRRCVTRQWLRFAFGRMERDDESSLATAHAAFAQSGYNLRELIIAITKTEGFLQ